MAAYMWLVNGEGMGFWELFQRIPSVTLWLLAIILFSNGISAYQHWYSMPVSFGCLRKHAFCGNLVMDLLVMGEGVIFYFLASAWFQVEVHDVVMRLILALLLLVEGISKIIGVSAMRWGKAAYVVMMIGIVAFSMAFGFLVGYTDTSGMLVSMSTFFGLDIIQTGQWMLIAVAVLVCLTANTVSWRMLRCFEVKA